MADFERLKLQPFTPGVADSFLGELAKAHEVKLSAVARKKIIELVGTPVPFFLQIMFSEVAKGEPPHGPNRIEEIYRDVVLGADCKGYFDHYYGRLRTYYRAPRNAAAHRLLREVAVQESLPRDTCFHIHQEAAGGETTVEDFNALMTDLENDFYITYESRSGRYRFACKILRDWWLRHYGLAVHH